MVRGDTRESLSWGGSLREYLKQGPNIMKLSVSGMVALVSLPWNWRRNPNRCSACLCKKPTLRFPSLLCI